jgi:hypothetical protein
VFNDVRIVGLDDSLTFRPISERTELLALHFTLSDPAPADWVKIANLHHLMHPIFTCGRRVQATTRHLVAHCSLTEAQSMLDMLKPIVATVNDEYRQYAAILARQQAEQEEREGNQKQRRQETAGSLKFD